MESRSVFIPQSYDVQNLKDLRDLPENRRENRLREMGAGSQLLQAMPRFPGRRGCKDLPFALLFLVTVAAVIAFVVYACMGINTAINDDSAFRRGKTMDEQDIKDIMADAFGVTYSSIIGCVGGIVTAFLWVMLAKACPRPVVYTSIYFIPVLFMMLGGALMTMGNPIPGAILAAIGALNAFCYWCCWSRFIPFTIEIVQLVATASNENPCMIVISAMAAAVSAVWTLLTLFGYAAFQMKHQKDMPDQNKHVDSPLKWVFIFIYGWGGGVIANVTHVAYCGIFSRWYFDLPVSCFQSVRVALTTSFGSVCFGTIIVAAITTLQVFLGSVRRAAQEDGNILGCIVVMILECIVGCIGDLLEYFNEWVFVQCAIRGSNYCESVRMTMTLVTCHGLQAIIGDLLINTVATLGAFLSGIVGAGLAFAFAGTHHWHNEAGLPIGVLGGFFGGLLAGANFMRIFSSGTKAILMCWAEEPGLLHQEHDFDDLHNEMNNKVREYQMS